MTDEPTVVAFPPRKTKLIGHAGGIPIYEGPAPYEEPYSPAAIYFAEADMLSYVASDIPVLARRVDDNFELLLDIDTREPVGFQLLGASRFIVPKP